MDALKQIHKIRSLEQAVSLISSGSRIMVGGFGLRGYPEDLIEALSMSDVNEITLISSDMGSPGIGLGKLLRNGQIKAIIGTHFGKNSDVADYLNQGKISVNIMPQGNFSEAIRAAAIGIPAFYSPIGVGTLLANGKEIRQFEGVECLLERALTADVALIKANKSDELGNLVYYKTARNFNPLMASAAAKVIVQVDEIVPVGSIHPETIVTPHIYVDIIVKRSNNV